MRGVLVTRAISLFFPRIRVELAGYLPSNFMALQTSPLPPSILQTPPSFPYFSLHPPPPFFTTIR